MQKLIEQSFSRHAATYDEYALVQKDIARALLTLNTGEFKNILELGCGTGNYTGMLRESLPDADILAIDISRAMLTAAQKKNIHAIKYCCADVAGFSAPGLFDLITSNACLQWVGGLEDILTRYKAMLTRCGVMTFSTFGPETFKELAFVLHSLNKNHRIPAQDFLSQEFLYRAARGLFSKVEIKRLIIKKNFKDLNSFLRSVKYSGTQGFGLGGKTALNRARLERIEEVYLDVFKKITATYEVFLCRLND